MNKTCTLTSIAIACLVYQLKATTRQLDAIIEKDSVLARGIYTVENNVRVTPYATLTIKAGTKILLKRGATLSIEGGLTLDGKPGNLIEITSENPDREGLGIIINGRNEKNILITYTRFTNLIVPIHFESNWIRHKVRIENCSFENIITGEPGIIIKKPDELYSGEKISFLFLCNNFTENNSGIYIEDLESDVMQLHFCHNLITDNFYPAAEKGGMNNTPLYVRYYGKNYKYKAEIRANSIFDNYITGTNNDTRMAEINISAGGQGAKYSVASNFFYKKNETEIKKTFDHFSGNTPFLDPVPQLQTPSDSAHGHCWKIAFGNKTLENRDVMPEITHETNIKLWFNRPLNIREGVKLLHYIYYDKEKDTTFVKSFSGTETGMIYNKEEKTLEFKLRDEVFKHPGYIEIKNIADNENFKVPNIIIGKTMFRTKK